MRQNIMYGEETEVVTMVLIAYGNKHDRILLVVGIDRSTAYSVVHETTAAQLPATTSCMHDALSDGFANIEDEGYAVMGCRHELARAEAYPPS